MQQENPRKHRNEAAKQRIQNQRNDRRRRGLCPYCEEKPMPGKSLCAKHYEIQRAAYAAQYEREKKAKPKPAADVFVVTPANRWLLTFSTDCPTVWTIAEGVR